MYSIQIDSWPSDKPQGQPVLGKCISLSPSTSLSLYESLPPIHQPLFFMGANAMNTVLNSWHWHPCATVYLLADCDSSGQIHSQSSLFLVLPAWKYPYYQPLWFFWYFFKYWSKRLNTSFLDFDIKWSIQLVQREVQSQKSGKLTAILTRKGKIIVHVVIMVVVKLLLEDPGIM